jgi:sortase A
VSAFVVPSPLVAEGQGGGLSSTPGQRAAPLPILSAAPCLTPLPIPPPQGGREHFAAPLRTTRRPQVVAVVAAALFLLGVGLVGQGVWIHAKALLAQVLLERAFAQSVARAEIVKPWSWADTWPVAVIELPRLGARVIALEGGTGQALAFGPGHVELTPDAGERGTAVYAAHRDTHFAFLRDARIGDEIRVTRRDGATFRFRVTATSVVHWDASGIDPLAAGQRLVLATCWPIEARTRGPLRYLVHAELVR